MEGASILASVGVVVGVTAATNLQKESQFRALQAEEASTKVGGGGAASRAGGGANLHLAPRPSHICTHVSLPPQVRAVRGGREVEVPQREVLAGDVLLVEAGDILCADGVLLAGVDIR